VSQSLDHFLKSGIYNGVLDDDVDEAPPPSPSTTAATLKGIVAEMDDHETILAAACAENLSAGFRPTALLCFVSEQNGPAVLFGKANSPI
jgi:hypothetical protein